MARKRVRNTGTGKNTTGSADDGDHASAKEDGDALWSHLVQNVQPIPRTDKRPPVDLESNSISRPEGAPPSRASGGGAVPARFSLDDISIGQAGRSGAVDEPSPQTGTGLEHGDAPGVDKRTAARFRRGQMTIEARLDLHGHSRESAHPTLVSFLTSEQLAGSRCVIVVTGKGLKEDWSPGVLREAVPNWLNSPPLKQIVLSFSYAQPKDGGSGALYVLLRRLKKTA